MPLHEPSPYEVLGLPPTAGVREINLAVGPAMRQGRHSRQQIQDAAALLRNPDRRLELDIQQLLPPEPVDGVAELLGPVLEEPLLVVERPPLTPADLLVVRREELAADFAEPAPASTAAEPPVPAQFAADLSVLPPIEIPE
ncbi:J domain-containing protein [Kitasatospora sp. DSM 101779]|uniref:J domain-containing protein n=1 Tax=Kitasatospora sp. DSM 101779 TaxID=2853165 RepID=UPI0021DA1C78|nr:J domain-containing protein [Kitasatospora sp. DSM 101779]MCU7826403.1 J domain-containing protein [Kitasatospora sp. DSM 101779]